MLCPVPPKSFWKEKLPERKTSRKGMLSEKKQKHF